MNSSQNNIQDDLMKKIVSLAKRRGFVFPSSEIYGGMANAWDFGPYGSQLKKNIKDHWWKFFVERRDDMVGLDAAIIMNPKVWEASGHLSHFSDPLVECKDCHNRFRADQIPGIEAKIKKGGMGMSYVISGDAKCPNCGKNNFSEPAIFNLMMETSLGPVHLGELYIELGKLREKEEQGASNEEAIKEIISKISRSTAYLRPETAQAMFVDFISVQQTSRKKLPFGVAQIGKAFRNEITPGNFIFRTREFEQMEIEYFFDNNKNNWNELFEYWKGEMERWMSEVGIDMKRVHAIEIPDGERAHYSKRTIDFEFEYPFGQKELFGLACRGDYDLKQHENASRQSLRCEDVLPHVIEPSLGVERGMFAIFLSAFDEEKLKDGDSRTVLRFKASIAPVQVAVFPLLKNKPELVEKAHVIYDELKKNLRVEFDDNGNIGKRYRRQDEIGTPYCVTVDFDSLNDQTVTVRDRDTMEQERVEIDKLEDYFVKLL